MNASHFRALCLSLSLLLACLLLPLNHTRAQTDDKTHGIQLYKQGDISGAAVALEVVTKRNKNDIEAWHYLGLALERQSKSKDARKAHEKAAKLGENLLFAQFEITGPPLDAALQNIKPLISQAGLSAERYLALSDKPSQKTTEEWRGRAEFLREFSAQAQKVPGKVYLAKEVTTKAVILFKPAPGYSDEARRNGTTGIITARVLLGSNGKVMFVQILKGLPDGLNGAAVEAARRIRFKPATKDGKPVSMWIMLQYDYSIY